MAEGPSGRLLVAGLLLVSTLIGAGQCPLPETSVLVSVADDQGVPVESFTLQVDERGRRTRTMTVDVDGATFVYFVSDPGATLLFFVTHPDYHPGVVLMDPVSPGDAAGSHLEVEITLVPSGTCLGVEKTCAGHVLPAPGPGLAPGQVVIGVNDWVYAREFPLLLAPYCLDPVVDDDVDAFAMWMDLVEGDVEDTIDLLEASAIVQWADVRGYEGDYHGTPILVQFVVGTMVNDAQDLVESIPGLLWIETVLAPTWGTVAVNRGTEAAWSCTLEQDPNIEYAHEDGLMLGVDDTRERPPAVTPGSSCRYGSTALW